jgi:hypothetical protein
MPAEIANGVGAADAIGWGISDVTTPAMRSHHVTTRTVNAILGALRTRGRPLGCGDD